MSLDAANTSVRATYGGTPAGANAFEMTGTVR